MAAVPLASPNARVNLGRVSEAGVQPKTESFMQPRWPWRLVGGVLALLFAYAFWYEPATLKAVEYRIPVDVGTPLRIAVIADLHAGAAYVGSRKIEEVVALANDAKPDLILITGDFVAAHGEDRAAMSVEDVAGYLGRLHARLGVYAVLGNHEQIYGAERAERALAAAGIPVLDDRSVRIGIGGPSLYLAGISDFNTAAHFREGALVGVARGRRAICFTHSPDVFPELPATCALTIAGHTHGGQVRLPYVGRLIVPSRYGQRYAAGLVRENGRDLFVATGIGTTHLPVRFGVPPEVSILDLR